MGCILKSRSLKKTEQTETQTRMPNLKSKKAWVNPDVDLFLLVFLFMSCSFFPVILPVGLFFGVSVFLAKINLLP